MDTKSLAVTVCSASASKLAVPLGARSQNWCGATHPARCWTQVYLFVRPKSDDTLAERLAWLLAGPLFDTLRGSIASVAARTVLIEADIREPGFGLSVEELKALRSGSRPEHTQLRCAPRCIRKPAIGTELVLTCYRAPNASA